MYERTQDIQSSTQFLGFNTNFTLQSSAWTHMTNVNVSIISAWVCNVFHLLK